jgi:GNAT superfamily N-acetyltransferase
VTVTLPLAVRDALPAELVEVAEVTRRAYAEYALESDPAFWTAYEVSTRAAILAADDARRLVVDVDGRIGASVLLCPPRGRNPLPELRLLAVLPEHRGLRLGALLVDACEAQVRADGFEAITLHTTRLMLTAKAMYERRGYVPYPELDFEPAPGFIVWGYRKTLG